MDSIRSLSLDTYSDPNGLTKMAEVGGSRPLTREELDRLSDRAFAVVVHERGGAIERRWPLHDSAHVVMAAHYWNEMEGVIPDSVRQVAASQILDAARLFGVSDLPHVGNLEREASLLAAKPKTNVVNLRGVGGRSSEETRTEQAPFRHAEYGAKKGKLMGEKGLLEKKAYALPSRERYPIDTPELVKKAADYFEQHWKDMPFSERFEMASSLLQADYPEGHGPTETIEKFASCDYTDHAPSVIRQRANFAHLESWPAQGREAVEVMAKAAEARELPARRLMFMLEAFDKEAGLVPFWNTKILDPAETFAAGDPRHYVGDDYVTSVGGSPVGLADLTKTAEAHQTKLALNYGAAVAKGLADASTAAETFRNLPEVHQKAVCALARA